MQWISEQDRLPPIAQNVLCAFPRQFGEFWDLKTCSILVRHEGVYPAPVLAGDRWPTDYYWSQGNPAKDSRLVTGNAWWMLLCDIPLPPGAQHSVEHGCHTVRQVDFDWVCQNKTET